MHKIKLLRRHVASRHAMIIRIHYYYIYARARTRARARPTMRARARRSINSTFDPRPFAHLLFLPAQSRPNITRRVLSLSLKCDQVFSSTFLQSYNKAACLTGKTDCVDASTTAAPVSLSVLSVRVTPTKTDNNFLSSACRVHYNAKKKM